MTASQWWYVSRNEFSSEPGTVELPSPGSLYSFGPTAGRGTVALGVGGESQRYRYTYCGTNKSGDTEYIADLQAAVAYVHSHQQALLPHNKALLAHVYSSIIAFIDH
jgi:hypothetical protein